MLELFRWQGTGHPTPEERRVTKVEGGPVLDLAHAEIDDHRFVSLAPFVMLATPLGEDGATDGQRPSLWLFNDDPVGGLPRARRDGARRVKPLNLRSPQRCETIKDSKFPFRKPFSARPAEDDLEQLLGMPDWSALGTLGRGASGRVLKVKTPNGLRAVKVLERRGRLSSAREKLLKKLADLSSSGRHGVVRYHVDESQIDRSPVFVVMEFLDAARLDEAVDDLDEEERRSVARQLVATVADLHDLGIAHRDLHPGNVLVRKTDKSAVLVDFTFAKDAIPAVAGQTALTSMLGRGWGVEPYAPQEQLGGQLTPRNEMRADVHALWYLVRDLLGETFAGHLASWRSPSPEGRPDDATQAWEQLKRALDADSRGRSPGLRLLGRWTVLSEIRDVGSWVGDEDGEVGVLLTGVQSHVVRAWMACPSPHCARPLQAEPEPGASAWTVVVRAPEGPVRAVGEPLGPQAYARFLCGMAELQQSLRGALRASAEHVYATATGWPWLLRPDGRGDYELPPLDGSTEDTKSIPIQGRWEMDLGPFMDTVRRVLAGEEPDEAGVDLLPHAIHEASFLLRERWQRCTDAVERQSSPVNTNRVQDVSARERLVAERNQIDKELRTLPKELSDEAETQARHRFENFRAEIERRLEELDIADPPEADDDVEAEQEWGSLVWKVTSVPDVAVQQHSRLAPSWGACLHSLTQLVELMQLGSADLEPGVLDPGPPQAHWTGIVIAQSLLWRVVSTDAAWSRTPAEEFEQWWRDRGYTHRRTWTVGMPSWLEEHGHQALANADAFLPDQVGFWGLDALTGLLGLLTTTELKYVSEWSGDEGGPWSPNRNYCDDKGYWCHGVLPFTPGVWRFGGPPDMPIQLVGRASGVRC